jgi:hypothetical protein
MRSLVCLLAASLAMPGAQNTTPPPSNAKPGIVSRVSADHDRLDVLAGTFHFERTTTLPGEPPKRTTGTSENRWILDNRYLQCRGVDDGSEGAGETLVTYGFDLRRRLYFAVLLGSRGSNYQTLEGFYDEPARSLVLVGRGGGDGRTAGPKLRQVVRIEPPDRYVIEGFIVPTGRVPQKVVETIFQRR